MVVSVSFPGFSQVTLHMRSTRKGTERTNTHRAEVTRCSQIHRSLPWGYVGEFMQPGIMNSPLKHTDFFPAAGRLSQPLPILLAGKAPMLSVALSLNSSWKEWGGLQAPHPETGLLFGGELLGHMQTWILLHPGDPSLCPGMQRHCVPGGVISGMGSTSEDIPINITGLGRASSISLLRANYNSSLCAQGGDHWGKHTQQILDYPTPLQHRHCPVKGEELWW